MKLDPKRYELYDASTSTRSDELGVAWLNSDGAIEAKALSDYLTDDEDRKEFKSTLGFSRPSEALWPLPVDPSKESVVEWESAHGPLLREIEDYYRKRAHLPHEGYYTLVSIWTIAAALRSRQMRFAPSLLLRSPFGWGKSTAAEAVALVVPRCVYGAVITPAAVYRVVSEFAPAMVVDESAIKDNIDLQRVVKTGFKRGPRIIRARQNADRGITAMDPWGWLVLTIQVDPADDVMSRCYPIDLAPGEPDIPVYADDEDALRLRTVLTRLRLEHAVGTAYADFRSAMAGVRTIADLDLRTKDKLESLWPVAVRYGVTEQIVAIAKELEGVAIEQYGVTDKGLVVAALDRLVSSKAEMKAEDLEVSRIHQFVTDILVEEGEAQEIPVRKSPDVVEIVHRLDRKYSVRDFTSKNLRELGFRVKTVMGRARVDIASFRALWPSVRRRYLGTPGVSTPTIPTIPTIDSYSKGVTATVGVEQWTPTTPLLTVGISRDKTGEHGLPEGLDEAIRRTLRSRSRYAPKPATFIAKDMCKEFGLVGPEAETLVLARIAGLSEEFHSRAQLE